ncbi:MAG: zincin-like metallopeptidase domain-containing protein [Hyphomicrobiaceae bacterium]
MARKPRTYSTIKPVDGATARHQDGTSQPKSVSEPRTKIDVHEAITAKIVAAIEAGAGTFEMPWHRPGVAFTIPKNASTEKAYRGSNILSLWIDADAKKFEHQVWATYKQYAELGAQVRKGEKGSLIVKYGEWVPKTECETTQPPENEDDQSKRMFAKAAWVFNIDQVDAPAELRERLLPATASRPDLTQRLAHVDAFIGHTRAEFREGGQRAFYRHRDSRGEGDFIQMPPRNLFTGTTTSTPTESFESTRLHELSHWVGAEHRLNRKFGERFGDKDYAFEELVAELSAAFLCAELGITNAPRLDHAQYVASWLEVLKGESKAIFTAASLATRAVAYLNDLQPKALTPAPAAPVDTGSNTPDRPPMGDGASGKVAPEGPQ